MNAINRRHFLHSGAVAATGLCLTGTLRSASSSPIPPQKRIAFNTANLVGRFTNYRFELARWGEQHQKTVAMTDEAAWVAICRDIAAAGFSAVEIWEAHAAPESLTRDKAARWNNILHDHGLRPIGYAGGLRRETLEICQWLNIPHVDGGLRGQTPEQATALCQEFGVRFNLENHPEKTVAEALAKVGGGDQWLGLCVDTGWFGNQGADVPAQIRAAGAFVRHTHIKDVKAAGSHETCLLGEGMVDVAGCLVALGEIGYTGWYSWEDEPEDRNPFDSAVRNREWMEMRLADSTTLPAA